MDAEDDFDFVDIDESEPNPYGKRMSPPPPAAPRKRPSLLKMVRSSFERISARGSWREEAAPLPPVGECL